MSAAWRAGAVHVVRVGRRACAECGLSQMSAGTRGAARARGVGEGEGRGGGGGGGLGEGKRGEERERARLGGRGRRLQKVPVRKDSEQKDLMMGLT